MSEQKEEEEKKEKEFQEYARKVKDRIKEIAELDPLPLSHAAHLIKLKKQGFEPKVIYDIGCSVLHWYKVAKILWPSAIFVLFDALYEAEWLYKQTKELYHVGVLTDQDEKQLIFYSNPCWPGGNSYYRENESKEKQEKNEIIFPDESGSLRLGYSLSTVQKVKNFPLPDLVKMDTQGSELDILKGSGAVLENCQHLLIELPTKDQNEYNKGAPSKQEIIGYLKETLKMECETQLFADNGPDGDFDFVPIKANKITSSQVPSKQNEKRGKNRNRKKGDNPGSNTMSTGGQVPNDLALTNLVVKSHLVSNDQLVAQQATIGGDLNVGGAVVADTVSANVIVGDSELITGASTFLGPADFTSGISVLGNSTFFNSVAVEGSTTLASLTVVGSTVLEPTSNQLAFGQGGSTSLSTVLSVAPTNASTLGTGRTVILNDVNPAATTTMRASQLAQFVIQPGATTMQILQTYQNVASTVSTTAVTLSATTLTFGIVPVTFNGASAFTLDNATNLAAQFPAFNNSGTVFTTLISNINSGANTVSILGNTGVTIPATTLTVAPQSNRTLLFRSSGGSTWTVY